MEKYYSPVYETNHSLQLKNAIKGENPNTDQVRKFKIFITLIFPQAFDPRLQWLAIFFDR